MTIPSIFDLFEMASFAATLPLPGSNMLAVNHMMIGIKAS